MIRLQIQPLPPYIPMPPDSVSAEDICRPDTGQTVGVVGLFTDRQWRVVFSDPMDNSHAVEVESREQGLQIIQSLFDLGLADSRDWRRVS